MLFCNACIGLKILICSLTIIGCMSNWHIIFIIHTYTVLYNFLILHIFYTFQEIIDSLDHETLAKVAKEGFMSRGLQLRDLVDSIRINPDEPQPSNQASTVPPFCVCGSCQEMPTDKERVCCKQKRLCRSKSLLFQNICLDSDNMATVIRSLADTYVFTATYDNGHETCCVQAICHVDTWTFRKG